MSTHKDDVDSFWDLDKLLPAKQSKPVPLSVPVSLPLIEVKNGTASAGINCNTENRPESVPPQMKPRSVQNKPEPAEDVFIPAHPLLKRVVVRKWKSSFNYYEDFYRDASRFANCKGIHVPATPFFSYVPQYSQLNASQFKWYLYWRTQLQDEKNVLLTDKSYVMLYLYEIINLGDKTEPQLGLQRLLFVWNAYKDTYPGINKYMSEWLIDYCLIHRVFPSSDELTFITPDMTDSCSLKEFYYRFNPEDSSDFSAFLLSHVSSYHYEQSKYYVGDNKVLYISHMPAAVTLLLSDESLRRRINECLNVHTVKIVRDAYLGALCSYTNKRKLEIEYVSFSHSHEVRYLIGDAVKYAENRLRACLGIKSRLSVYSLPESVKKMIDSYFNTNLPYDGKNVRGKREEYEVYYDVPEKELSVSDAKAIEELSWDTTDKLIASATPALTADVVSDITALQKPSAPAPAAVINTKKNDNAILLHKEFVVFLAFDNLDSAKQYCRDRQLIFDSLLNEVNETAVEVFGDVLFENGHIIEEYKTDLLKYCEAEGLSGKEYYERK